MEENNNQNWEQTNSQDNNAQKPNNKPGQQGNQAKRNNNNGKRKGSEWFMYIVYAVIILSLGGVWLGGGSKGATREISWSKLDEILRRGDQEKIVIVDGKYAEIFIKEDAIKATPPIATCLVPTKRVRQQATTPISS